MRNYKNIIFKYFETYELKVQLTQKDGLILFFEIITMCEE